MVWSLVGRQETCLSQPEWEPSGSSPRYLEESLSYLGLRLSTLFSRMDQATDVSNSRPVLSMPAVHCVLMELSSMEQELICWYNDYQVASGHPAPLYWPDPTTQDEDALGVAGFSFRPNDTGHQLVTYWTLRLLITANIHDAVLNLKRLRNKNRTDELGIPLDNAFAPYYLDWLLDLHSKTKRIALCNNIIRGSLYTTHERFGLESMQASIFPLGELC